MANDIAIAVEGLSKCYLVGHNEKRNEHDTLRDQIVRNLRGLVRKTSDMAHGRAVVQGDTVEEFWALRDVSFEIPRGARVGILGRNGAGKSTLLKLLSRITEPTKGCIRINGRVASLLEVGTGFHPELTGRENIFLNGAILGMSRREIQRKFDEIVDFAEVDRFLDTPVKRYSSGMYVRLAFSVAAHLEPDILIVDEVLAVGDAAFQDKCLGKLEKAERLGRTVVFVSHNMNAISRLCERGILLSSGQTILDAPAADAIQAYLGAIKTSSDTIEFSELDHLASWGGHERVRVLQIKLLNGANTSFSVFWKQPIRIQITFEVRSPMRNITFGVGISTTLGESIISSHHTDNGMPMYDLAVGTHTLTITVENPLRQGRYALSVGAKTSIGNSSVFHIQDAATLEVLNVGLENEHPPEYSGIINGQVGWQHSTLTSSIRSLHVA